MEHPDIDDLCANSDCGLCDEGHLDQFQSYADWNEAHKGCYWNEGRGEAQNNGFHRLFRFDETLGKWAKV